MTEQLHPMPPAAASRRTISNSTRTLAVYRFRSSLPLRLKIPSQLQEQPRTPNPSPTVSLS